MTTTPLNVPSINPDEIAYFENLAYRWWDTNGPFRPLHEVNDLRFGYMTLHDIEGVII